MSINIEVGAEYLHNGLPATIKEVAGNSALVTRYGSGQIVKVALCDLQEIPKAEDDDFLPGLTIPEDEWLKASTLANDLREFIKLSKGKTKEAERIARVHHFSSRHIYNLASKFEQAPFTQTLLKGKKGRPTGLRLLGYDRELVVAESIDSYLKEERPSITDLMEEIEMRCSDLDLKPPCRNAVTRRIGIISEEVKVRRRHGKKRAKELCKAAPGHFTADYPLEKVQVDHTLADVILLADTPNREVIGRPWLTLAIDCATRMVVGFYISFDRPNAESVAKCIVQAVSPKEHWLEEYGIPEDWPVQGMWKQIWLDNAMEFRSQALLRGADNNGMFVFYRPVGSPEVGGIIERLIGTMMGKVHLLPGTTKSNVHELGDYEAEKRAVMTLSEFTAWFCEQVVTHYHLTTHRTLGVPPIVAWRRMTAGNEPKAPKDLRRLYSEFLPFKKRKLGRRGVYLNGLQYWSDAFQPYVGEGKQVIVSYDNSNISRVFVRMPDGMVVVAKSVVADMEISRFEWNLRKEHARQIGRAPELTEKRKAGRRRGQLRVEQAKAETRKARRLPRFEVDAPDDILVPTERSIVAALENPEIVLIRS